MRERYDSDALGRRVVVVHTWTPQGYASNGQCFMRCDTSIRRTIWDGDQVLGEIRYPDAVSDQDTGLDASNAAAAAQRDSVGTTAEGHTYGGRYNTTLWAQSGRVLYVHGGGIDQPLGMVRMDYSYTFPDPVLIIPHANWRSAYETSTFSNGSSSQCVNVWLRSTDVVGTNTAGGAGSNTLPGDPNAGTTSGSGSTSTATCSRRGAWSGTSRARTWA